ncbi:MAG: hypothetical protein F4246_05345 [Rhodothermaceae bacterium]|nr:hypothetical protein [Rhodothermaceae bacterium]MXX58416.1 hypothetical protein [Rhodothermaceae bacterium]MYD20119.1 hypothetical protein [Rhodothermaceae bacterium]MYD56421.1 hypothetical protein [Rhodothermaceae bacterium]MYI44143.1 hypothetical protein [Rhodothermaceae bacterium]
MSNKKVKNTNPMVHLFAQYLAGQIEEPLWKKFISALESFESNPLERSAFIVFFEDSLAGTNDRSAPRLNRLLVETVTA